MCELCPKINKTRDKKSFINFDDFFCVAYIPGPCTWTFPRRMK